MTTIVFFRLTWILWISGFTDSMLRGWQSMNKNNYNNILGIELMLQVSQRIRQESQTYYYVLTWRRCCPFCNGETERFPTCAQNLDLATAMMSFTTGETWDCRGVTTWIRAVNCCEGLFPGCTHTRTHTRINSNISETFVGAKLYLGLQLMKNRRDFERSVSPDAGFLFAVAVINQADRKHTSGSSGSASATCPIQEGQL